MTSTEIVPKYFDYPLEQGLRHSSFEQDVNTEEYFDYPLEQGLRQGDFVACMPRHDVF